MPKILFLTTAHHYNDDRILYHQALALKKQDFEIKICSLSSDFVGQIKNIEVESYNILANPIMEKLELMRKVTKDFQPDCIIASEPLAVIAASKVKKNAALIYDITEWYPSKRILSVYSPFTRIFHAIKFLLIQVYAGFLSTHFIFGEESKMFPLANIFPFKKQILLPYYPDAEFIRLNINQLQSEKICLGYTGEISKEKGIENFLEVANELSKRRPNLKLSIVIVGASKKSEDEIYFKDLIEKFDFKNLKLLPKVTLEEFSSSFAEADIMFDLRDMSFENHHCLPIKIFYYAGSGKPVIYTDLKAIRKHMNATEFGFLADPENTEVIVDYIENYLDNHHLYSQHAKTGRELFEKKYNWNAIKPAFISFINSTIK